MVTILGFPPNANSRFDRPHTIPILFVAPRTRLQGRVERWRILALVPADLTQILTAIDRGDCVAAEQLLPLVYDELRRLASARMAQEAPGHTLQATALVHEAYVRLIGATPDETPHFDGRGHFFAAAAEAMRRILVDRARAKGAVKWGGDRRRLELDASAMQVDAVPIPSSNSSTLQSIS